MAERIKPRVVYRQIVGNQSTRTAKPRLIVVHATQSANLLGIKDLAGIGSWFDSPQAQASAHVCVDGEGKSARFVSDSRKAWHVASYNSLSLGVEQVGFTDVSAWTDAQLKEVARWVARWSILHGIPIQKAVVRTDRVEVAQSGVVRHSELGVAGGNHFDPGMRSYPLHDVLEMARRYRGKL